MNKDVKVVCSKCSWKSFDACKMCDLRDADRERIQSKFKEGQVIVYKNDSRCETDRIKRVVEEGRIGQRMWNKWLMKLVRLFMK